MLTILKFSISMSAGIVTFLILQSLLKYLHASAAKTSNLSSKKSIKESVESSLGLLAENPHSKHSRKTKLLLSSVFFIFSAFAFNNIIFGIVFAVGLYFLIGWHFKRLIKKRSLVFDEQLIEGLEIITNSVRSGQSFPQALENMVNVTKTPLSTEFNEVQKQIRLGVPVNKALASLTERIDSRDLKIAVISINLSRETGGSMSEILKRLIETMRERRKIQGKINALTSQGKASGVVMSSAPFLLMAILYFIEPEMTSLLFTTTLGNIMIVAVIIMLSAGFFLINRIIKIDI